MKQYYIYNRQIGILEAVKQCGGIAKFKSLISEFKKEAGKETHIRINSKTLSIYK